MAPAPVPAAADERELIAAILRNDRKAAAQLVTRHIDAVYAFVRHRLTPRADLVDDVVQDVFLAALNGLPSFQGQSTLRTWLIGIARHKIEDLYRKRLRGWEALDDTQSDWEASAPNVMTLDDTIDAARARTRARHVLTQLPERYALLLLWRYWERRTTRDMAAALGVTDKSVERMLARARASFRALWIKE